MHKHSMEAFSDITKSGSKESRLNAVLEAVMTSSKPLRDWDILQKLFPGASDLNLVQPRISELHKIGKLIEGPPMANPLRTRNVRTSVYVNPEPQLDLF